MKLKRILSVAVLMAFVLSFVNVTQIFAEDTSSTVFQDSLTDLSKISDYGLQNIAFYECDAGSNLNGDQAIMINSDAFNAIKDSSGQMVVYPYLTWKVNGGAKVEFFTYLWDASYNFTLSWSSDGYQYHDIDLSTVQIDEITDANKTEKGLGDEYKGGAADVTHRLYTINQIDATAQYFKVTWQKIDGSWKAAPSMLRFTGGQAASEDLSCDTTVTISNNKDADTKDMVSYTDAFDFDQKLADTPVLMVNYYYLSGKTSVVNPYVIYKVEDNKAFKAAFLAHETFFKMNGQIKFYVSDKADSGWTEVAAAKERTAISGNSNVSTLNYTIPSVPDGKNYVKVEYPYDQDYSNVSWADGTPGTPGNPLTYMVALSGVQYNKYTEPAPVITTDTQIDIQGNSSKDAANWKDYTKDVFDFTQKLGTTPFLSLDYYAVYGKTSLPEIYVTYQVKEGSPFVLKGINHVSMIDLGKKFKLMSSSDGITWEEIPNVIYTVTASETYAGFYNEEYVVQSIPATHKYVKIVWPNEKDYSGTADPVQNDTISDPVNYAPGLMRVEFNKSDEINMPSNTIEAVFTGNENADSAFWEDYTKKYFDFDQKLNGTPFLSLKYDSVLGTTSLPEAYVVYKVEKGSPFILKAFTNIKMVHLGLKFKIYSSEDMTNWTEITDFNYSTSNNVDGWYNEIYTVSAISASHKYVKVVWPNEKDYTGTKDPVDGTTITDPLHYVPGLVSATYIQSTEMNETTSATTKNTVNSTAAANTTSGKTTAKETVSNAKTGDTDMNVAAILLFGVALTSLCVLKKRCKG